MVHKQPKSKGAVGPTRRNADDPVKAVLERLVSATDPRLRGVSGYARKLREPVEQTLSYVNELVAALAPPLEVSREARDGNALLRAVFPTADDLEVILLASGRARQDLLRRLEPRAAEAAFGTLLLSCIGAHRNGEAQPGLESLSDGPLLTLVAGSEGELGDQLKARAMEHLAECALWRIVGESDQHGCNGDPHGLLRAKLKAVERQGGGFAGLWAEREPPAEALEAARRRLGQIERDLGTVHVGAAALGRTMVAVREVLEAPRDFLRHERVELTVNAGAKNGTAPRRCACDQLTLDSQRRLAVVLARVLVADIRGN